MRSSIWRFELPSKELAVIHDGTLGRCLDAFDDHLTRLGIIRFNQINVDKSFTMSHVTLHSIKFVKRYSL
jgi:hypothetical protein